LARKRNPPDAAAVELGRRGGLARAAKLAREERTAIAKKGAQASKTRSSRGPKPPILITAAVSDIDIPPSLGVWITRTAFPKP
jgi:hypothetical protein